MSAVTIHKEGTVVGRPLYRAIAGEHELFGKTAGEALDNLNAEYGGNALVVVQQMQSDAYFSEPQFLRMQELLGHRDGLTDLERSELEDLAKAELIASSKRTEALADALGR